MSSHFAVAVVKPSRDASTVQLSATPASRRNVPSAAEKVDETPSLVRILTCARGSGWPAELRTMPVTVAGLVEKRRESANRK
jgi:hypothetical protein